MRGILRYRHGKWFVETRESDGITSHKENIIEVKSQMFSASLQDKEVEFEIEIHEKKTWYGMVIKEEYAKIINSNNIAL